MHNYSEKDKENNIIATLTRSRVLHVSYASMALVRRPHHEPQLCILTLARTVPLPSIMTISNQPWYSKFAAHIIFHEDYEIFPNDRLIGKSSFHRIQLINVRAFFERSAVRARWDRWRSEQIEAELLLHVLHAMGMIRWIR